MHFTLIPLALGVVAGMQPCSANAQARGESVLSVRERMHVDPEFAYMTNMSDLDIWLRRLPGRFLSTQHGTGMIFRVDCASVGSGPGVQCVSKEVTRYLSIEAPEFTLYGLDPELPGIRTLKVSGLSIADHDEAGRLRGNTVTFQSPCPLPVHDSGAPIPSGGPITVIRCEHQIRIFAPPDSDHILVGIRTDSTRIMPTPPAPTDGSGPPTFDRFVTDTSHAEFEWQRLADGDPSAPVLQLESVELESLGEYGKAEIPQLVGHVADQAGILAPAQRTALESQLAAYEASTSQRIIVVTVARLNGLSIESFSRQASATWQLGSEARTNFTLVAVAPNDGAARIEAGEAMLACVPDTTALQILEEAMVPDFTYRRFGEGIRKGVAALMAACREWRAATEEP